MYILSYVLLEKNQFNIFYLRFDKLVPIFKGHIISKVMLQIKG